MRDQSFRYGNILSWQYFPAKPGSHAQWNPPEGLAAQRPCSPHPSGQASKAIKKEEN